MSMQKLSDPVQLVLNTVIKIAESKKSENIRCFSVSEKMWMTDYILIVDIKNKIHGRALCDDIKKKLSTLIPTLKTDAFYDDIHYSGGSTNDWIILDLNSIIVHCISDELNDYYKLDHLFEKYGVLFHI